MFFLNAEKIFCSPFSFSVFQLPPKFCINVCWEMLSGICRPPKFNSKQQFMQNLGANRVNYEQLENRKLVVSHQFKGIHSTFTRTTAHLIPKVVCSRVTRPDTKYIVPSTSLMTSVLFAKHIGPLRRKGIANVPPNMVRKC